MIEKRHKAATDGIDALLAIQGAATSGEWTSDGAAVIGCGGFNYDLAQFVHSDDSTASASGHNTQNALLTVAKGQLQSHYDDWYAANGYDTPEEGGGDEDTAIYHAGVHKDICKQLCESPAPQFDKVREMLKEVN